MVSGANKNIFSFQTSSFQETKKLARKTCWEWGKDGLAKIHKYQGLFSIFLFLKDMNIQHRLPRGKGYSTPLTTHPRTFRLYSHSSIHHEGSCTLPLPIHSSNKFLKILSCTPPPERPFIHPSWGPGVSPLLVNYDFGVHLGWFFINDCLEKY